MNQFQKNFASVYTDDKGQHKIVMPNGDDVTHLVSTITIDEVDEDPICHAKFLVNIVKDRDEALQNYNK